MDRKEPAVTEGRFGREFGSLWCEGEGWFAVRRFCCRKVEIVVGIR